MFLLALEQQIMTEISNRLESIRQQLQTFRSDQEPQILNFSDDQKFRPSNRSQLHQLTNSNNNQKLFLTTDSVNNSKLVLNRNNISAISNSDGALFQSDGSESMNVNRILNTEAIIMPVGLDTISKQRVWSNALVSKIYNDKLRVGNIESHGSLWKLIPRSDNYPGHRVLLQSSENGEEIKYVNSSLELVESKADAAVWNVRIPDHQVAEGSQESVEVGKGVSKGLQVIFELVDDIALEKNFHIVPIMYQQDGNRNHGGSQSHNGGKQDPIVLVCVYSSSATGHELQLRYLNHHRYYLNQKDRESTEAIIQSCTFIWEICPEDWINEEIDFLERYLT